MNEGVGFETITDGPLTMDQAKLVSRAIRKLSGRRLIQIDEWTASDVVPYDEPSGVIAPTGVRHECPEPKGRAWSIMGFPLW